MAAPQVPPNPSLESGLSTAGHLGREAPKVYLAPRGPGSLPRPAAQLEVRFANTPPSMRLLVLTLLLATTPVFGQAVWRLTTDTDAMTDKVKRSASTVNSQGHELSVYRGPKDAAWVLFSLGKSSFDTLSPKQAPMYRVDKLQPHDLDTDRRMSERGLGLDLYRWEPRWINFSIWHGKEVEGRSVQLKELMSGQTVVFRYYLGTGGYKETSFSLEGAGPVIAEALGISLAADPATDAAADAYKTELLAASRKCQQDMRTFRTCFERVTACEKKAQRDLRVLQECLQYSSVPTSVIGERAVARHPATAAGA